MSFESLSLSTYKAEYKDCLSRISSLPKKYASILETKKVAATDLSATEVKGIVALTDIDEKLDRMRAFLGGNAGKFFLFTLLIIGGTFAVYSKMSMTQPVIIVGSILSAITGIIFLGFFLKKLTLGKHDLPDRFEFLVAPLISAFLDDLPADKTCNINFDLTGPQKRHKAGKTEKLNSRSNIKQTLFTDPFFSIELPLDKGWNLQCKLTEVLRKRVKTKRSASGKYKTKVKYKSYNYVDVTLTTPVNFKIASDAQAQTKVKVKNGEKRNSIRTLTKTTSMEREAMKITTVLEAVSTVFARVQRVAEPNA